MGTVKHVLEKRNSFIKLKFNVGGKVFLTSDQTLDKLTLCQSHANGFLLSKINRQELERRYFCDNDKEFFLDRDPEIFRYVINFVRTGSLHVPPALCASQVLEELKFWGLEISDMENCCWKNFYDWESTEESLCKLEASLKMGGRSTGRGKAETEEVGGKDDDAEDEVLNHEEFGDETSRRSCCHILWDVLTSKNTSHAKIYGWISLLFGMASIFSFCFSTHSAFRVPIFDDRKAALNVTSLLEVSVASTSATTPTRLPTVEERLEETEIHEALWYLDFLCLAFFAADLALKIVSCIFKERDIECRQGDIDHRKPCNLESIYQYSGNRETDRNGYDYTPEADQSEAVLIRQNENGSQCLSDKQLQQRLGKQCALCRIRNSQPEGREGHEAGPRGLWSSCKARFYLLTFGGVVDLLAILPDIVMVAAHYTSYVLPMLRLMRVFRIFRLFRYFSELWIMVYTLKASWKDLFLMFICMSSGILIFASLIFFVDDKEMFPSIPHGFWWAVVTMTTVGYGDKYPVTELGYLVGSMAAISGVLVIGFSVPALINNFTLYHTHVKLLNAKRQQRRRLRLRQRGNTSPSLGGGKA